ncbi:MAG: hypothetical protein AAGC92_12125 [Pseudomonadota bacterium]
MTRLLASVLVPLWRIAKAAVGLSVLGGCWLMQPQAVAAEDAADVAAFFALADTHCLPWFTAGARPDTAGMTRIDPDNPAHQDWGPLPPDSFLTQQDRTLLSWSVEEGTRRCDLTFFETAGANFEPSPLANAVAQAAADWVRSLGEGAAWRPLFTCVQGGFGLFRVYERTEALRDGITIQVIVSAGGAHKKPESWGAFTTIGYSETPFGDPTCLSEEG